jgi:FAD/FMN-containing dehydrogenase
MEPAEKRVAEKLRGLMKGQVLSDQATMRKFSLDQSIYEIMPRIVVFPEDIEEVRKIVAFAAQEGLPITPRGGGSGTAGSALGEGLVMALPDSGYWGRISGFSEARGLASVTASAGVFHNDLQVYLKERGFFLPADVTSAAISRIGGNIATKASGPHALKYGSIDRFLESIEFVTADGELVDTADETTIPAGMKTKFTRLEQKIRSDDAARTLLESRRRLKTSSGYNLFAFLDNISIGRKITQLVAGSVGTLGIISSARLRAEVYTRDRAAVLLYFDGLAEAGRAASLLRETDAAAIELISRETIRIMRVRTALPDQLAVDAHMLFVELTGPERQRQLRNILNRIQHDGYRMSAPPAVAVSDAEIERIWTVRKQILWLIQHPGPGFRALAVVNDVGVPPGELAVFISDVQKVFFRHGISALVYGHAGNGNLHLRPLFDVTLPDLPGRVRRLADDVYEALFRHGGTVTAEHGMGRLRAPYLKREWGEALYGYMREIKTIFDPGDILNPGVMFSDAPITDNMRKDLLEP